MKRSTWVAIHLFVGLIYVLLIGICIVGIFLAAAKGIFYAAVLFLLGIGAMIYFATDGWKKREDE